MKLKLTAVFAALSVILSDCAMAQQGMGVGNANPQEMLDVTGAIKIGTDINNSNAAPTGGAGTIRFRAGQFEGWDGAAWIPLGGGGGNSPFFVNTNLVQPNTSFVTYATDDFIFGSPSLDDNGNTDNDGRFFYDKSKGAFRAGLVTGDQWNDIKRGNQSFAAGFDVTASGDYSIALGERSWAIAQGAIAMGQQAYAEGVLSFALGDDVQATGTSSVALGSFAYATADHSYAVGANVNATAEYSMAVGSGSNASGLYAIALGDNATASAESAFALGSDATASAWEAAAIGYDVSAAGEQSIAFGHDLQALSNYEIVLGRYNSIYVPSSTNSWEPTDRLFTIGNGDGFLNRSNALTILKNGSTGIGTSTPSATLHVDGSFRLVDGNQTNGYVLTSDGSGNATWQAASTGSDNQNLTGATLTGTSLEIAIEDGTSATVDLSALVDDADADATNELQTLSVSGADVTLSNGGGTVTVNDGDWTVNGNDQYSAVNGRVGIGTSTPNSKLHVTGGGYFENNLTSLGDVRLENTNGSGTNNPLFRLDGFLDKLYIVAEGGANGPTNGTEIRFRTSGGGTASDRMTIDNAGNVGVGTTTPTQKLHVNGSIRMVDGNQAAGYIPVSDANGRMVWTDPTTIATAADGDGNSSNELQTLSQSGTDVTLSNGGGTISVADNDNDASNEIQSLSLTGNTLAISGSNDVDLSVYVSTDDQNLTGATLTGTSLQIDIEGGSSTTVDLSSLVDDADADASNELQTLSISGNDITLSNGGGTVSIPNDDDWVISGNDMYNANSGNVGIGETSPDTRLHVSSNTTGEATGLKLTQSNANSLIYHNADRDLIIRKQGQTNQLVLDNGGSVGIGTVTPGNRLHVEGSIRMVDGNQTAGFIPVSDVNGKMTWTDPTTITTAADGDGDSSNELQTLSQSGNDVTLSNGGGTISVADNDNDLANELQSLSISGNDITLSNGGGTVSVPTQTLLADADGDTKIQVEESADEDIIRFDTDGTERMVIQNDGKVGIGTNTPNNKLQVVGSMTVGAATQTNTGNHTLVVGQTNDNSGSRNLVAGGQQDVSASNAFVAGGNHSIAGNYSVALNHSNSTTNAGTVSIVGGFQCSANNSISLAIGLENTASGSVAQVFGRGNEAHSYSEFVVGTFNTDYTPNNTTGINASDRLFTIGNGTSATNRSNAMTVLKNGNVGVGVDVPDTKLHISASTNGDATGIKLTQGTANSLIYHNSDNDLVLRKAVNTNQLVLDNGGNIGVGTETPADELHVEGSIRMVDGNQADGYVATSDANGTMTWENPRRAVNFIRQPTGTTGANSSAWIDFVSDATKTIDVTTGDIISVWADCNVRFASGSGNDDLQYKVRYSGCASGELEDRIIRFDEDSGHDNWNSLAYADAMVAPCTGTLTFEYSIRRITGDDPWEAINGVVIFRKN